MVFRSGGSGSAVDHGCGARGRRARDDLRRVLPGLFRAGAGIRAEQRPPPRPDARPVTRGFPGSDSQPSQARRARRCGDHGGCVDRRSQPPGIGAGRQQGRPRALADRHGRTRRGRETGHRQRRRVQARAAERKIDRVLGQRERHLSVDDTLCKAGRCRPGGGQEPQGEGTAVRRAGGSRRGARRGGNRFSAGQRTDTRARRHLRRRDSGRVAAGHVFFGGAWQCGQAAGGGGGLASLSCIARSSPGNLEGRTRTALGAVVKDAGPTASPRSTRGKCTDAASRCSTTGANSKFAASSAYRSLAGPRPGFARSEVGTSRCLWSPASTNRHFTANTQTAPPCGTSGYWPGKIRFMRVCIFAGSTPQPDCTAIYCLPSTWNDTGTAATPEAVGNSHSTLPVLASNARNMRSLVPPANSNPPPVARTGPQLNDGMLVVHTFLPVSRFQACSSPMWSAPATIFSTFFATPWKRSPCTYFGGSPVSWVQRLSLAGM